MEAWKVPYFLILTEKACNAQQLKAYITSMHRTFQKIIEKYRKKQRIHPTNYILRGKIIIPDPTFPLAVV